MVLSHIPKKKTPRGRNTVLGRRVPFAARSESPDEQRVNNKGSGKAVRGENLGLHRSINDGLYILAYLPTVHPKTRSYNSYNTNESHGNTSDVLV